MSQARSNRAPCQRRTRLLRRRRRVSPRTQTPLSCLRRPGLGRGSRFLRSSPGPLCEGSDSCQGGGRGRKKRKGRTTDRQTRREAKERRGELGVRKNLSTKKKSAQYFEVTGFFFSPPHYCLCCSKKNKGFVKGLFTAVGERRVCAIKKRSASC